MEVEVEYLFEWKKKVKLKEKARVKDLLEKLEINPETVVVRREKNILTSDELLKDGDKVQIISVVSGG